MSAPLKAELLIEAISRLVAGDDEIGVRFELLLDDLLALTDSEYGYVAEVIAPETGDPYLRTWAITDISWDAETRTLFEEHAIRGGGLEFRNLDTLFGLGLRERSVVISNRPADDQRGAGTPPGHPPLHAYLAVPVVCSGTLVGQIGLANRPGGYTDDLVRELEPLTATLAHLIAHRRAADDCRAACAQRLRAERRIEKILDSLHDMVAIVAADGSLLYSNAAVEQLVGFPTGFDPDRGIFSLLHADDVAAAEAALARVVTGRTGRPPTQLRVRAADGGHRTCEFDAWDLRHDEAVRGILLNIRDVTREATSEAHLVETSAQLTALVTNLRDGVLFLDDHRRIVFVNQLMFDMFDMQASPASAIGTEVSTIRSGGAGQTTDPDGFVERVERTYRAWRHVGPEEVAMRDGRTLEREYIPVPLEDDRRGHLWIYRDVTERKWSERQQAVAEAHERAMRKLVEDQNVALRDLADLKANFLAEASHEIRTPLTSVVSFVQFLMDDREMLSEEHAEFVERIAGNSAKLLRLVDDLLLTARLESHSITLEKRALDVGRLVEEAAASIRPQADAAGVSVRTRCTRGTSLVCDPGRMEQVLANLLSNAIKFTPAGGRVTVGASPDPDGGSTISVEDTGIGIPAGQVDKVFERFARASNAEDGAEGSGLGLVISRAIVELHNGTLQLMSTEGKGTTALVRIPPEVEA